MLIEPDLRLFSGTRRSRNIVELVVKLVVKLIVELAVKAGILKIRVNDRFCLLSL